MVTGVTGALAPISDLLASVNSFNTTSVSSTNKSGSTVTSSKSPSSDLSGNNSLSLLKDLFDLDPAGGTSFNNLLYGTSGQSTSTNKKDDQTNLPPLFGGTGFTPVKFDLFNNPLSGLTGLDAVMAADTKASNKNSNVKTTTSPNTDYGNLSFDALRNMTLGDLMKLFNFS